MRDCLSSFHLEIHHHRKTITQINCDETGRIAHDRPAKAKDSRNMSQDRPHKRHASDSKHK